MRGHCTYREMFVDKLFSMQDIDLMWQMISYNTVADLWSGIEAEKKRK